jgi:hypothetical protein
MIFQTLLYVASHSSNVREGVELQEQISLPSLRFASGRQVCKILQQLLPYREHNLFNPKIFPCHSSVINIH